MRNVLKYQSPFPFNSLDIVAESGGSRRADSAVVALSFVDNFWVSSQINTTSLNARAQHLIVILVSRMACIDFSIITPEEDLSIYISGWRCC